MSQVPETSADLGAPPSGAVRFPAPLDVFVTVVDETFVTRDGRRRRALLLRCSCGKVWVARPRPGRRLRGCRSCAHLRHGHARDRTPTYRSWMAMLARARDPSSRWGGGVGIGVCEAWQDFEQFARDVGEAPDGALLDRVDRARGYEPGNVRWSSREAHARRGARVRLSLEIAREVRRRAQAGERPVDVAASLGLEQGDVSSIMSGRAWRDSEEETA